MKQTKCCVFKGKACWLASLEHANILFFLCQELIFNKLFVSWKHISWPLQVIGHNNHFYLVV